MTPTTGTGLPTHKDLPETDGSIVENYQECTQSALLKDCLTPRLRELRPDGQFAVGTDSGIYWRLTDPPLSGCKSPDFFVVLGVPPILDGEVRRSYVLWQEHVRPLLVAEFVSGTGAEERDRTPNTGKFWVYERGIVAGYYAIFDGFRDTLEVYRLRDGRYEPVEGNPVGRFPVPELRVELGIWHGLLHEMDVPWLRFWDTETKVMMPSSAERADAAEGIIDDIRREAGEQAEQARQARRQAEVQAEQARQERQRADAALRQAGEQAEQARQERQRAQDAIDRAARLAERLRQLGLDPDAA